MDLFLKTTIDLVQSLTLAPIVKGAGDVDVVGRIRPMRESARTWRKALEELRQCASLDNLPAKDIGTHVSTRTAQVEKSER